MQQVKQLFPNSIFNALFVLLVAAVFNFLATVEHFRMPDGHINFDLYLTKICNYISSRNLKYGRIAGVIMTVRISKNKKITVPVFLMVVFLVIQYLCYLFYVL